MILFETKVVREAKVLCVEWLDSVSGNGWQHFDSNTKESMNIVSVGFIIESTETFIVLVPHLHKGSDGMPCGMMGGIQIPKKAITSIQEMIIKPKEEANATNT